jgi:hypothetical protein
MSDGSTHKSAQRPTLGGGGMMFLLMIAVGGFLLFRNGGSGDQKLQPESGSEEVHPSMDYTSNRPSDGSDNSVRAESNIGGGGDFEPRPKPANVRQSQPRFGVMEDVDRAPELSKSSDNQFHVSNSSNKSDTLPVAESGGDWAIKDAE